MKTKHSRAGMKPGNVVTHDTRGVMPYDEYQSNPA